MGPLGLAPWDRNATSLGAGFGISGRAHFGTSNGEGGWQSCGDHDLALPLVPGENVLSLGPGGLAWVSGLALYGYCPGPKSAERSGLWAEVAAIQVDAGPPSSWEWDHEEGLGLAFWWSLAGPGTGVQGSEPGGGAGGGRAAHQVGALPSLETPPSCPGLHGACGGATRRGLPPRGGLSCALPVQSPQPPLTPCSLRQLGLWPGRVELGWGQHPQGSEVLTKGQ